MTASSTFFADMVEMFTAFRFLPPRLSQGGGNYPYPILLAVPPRAFLITTEASSCLSCHNPLRRGVSHGVHQLR